MKKFDECGKTSPKVTKIRVRLTPISTGWFFKNVRFRGLKLPRPRRVDPKGGVKFGKFRFCPENVPEFSSFGK